MRSFAEASSLLPKRLLALTIGAAILELAVALPARSADFAYPDQYEGPTTYQEPYGDPPVVYAPRPVYPSPYGCREVACTPVIVHRSPVIDHREPVFERRYIEREYVVRRYAAPWHEPYGYEGVPRPPVAVPSLPSSYYYYNDYR